MKKLTTAPLLIGAGAIYPFSEKLLEEGERETRYGEEYNMFRVFGVEPHQKIIVPRNMAPNTGITAAATTKDLRSNGVPYKFTSNFKPRNDEQARVIAEAVKLLRMNTNFMVQAPTGFGKGASAMDIIAKVGLKTIVVVTKEDIRDQWIAEAKKTLGLELGNGVGLIQGDVCNVVGQGIVIAMVHSLAKEARYPESVFRDFGLMIFDECHRVGADYFSQSCYRIPARKRMGISATPDRKDGREEVLEAHLGRVMVKSEAAPMTPRIMVRKSPWECPLTKVKDKKTGGSRVGTIPHGPTNCGHIINMLMKHHERNRMMARLIAAAYRQGRTVMAQSDRKEHLEIIAPMIAAEGVPPVNINYYVGGMKEEDRAKSKKGRIILCTYQMTAEATDIPGADTLVMMTPKSDVRQIVGRVIRFLPDKKEPLVFDLVDYSSPLFSGYAKARQEWYKSVGAKIEFD
jgi:superfamily II DNA or RNA helicase